jgi:hypothetical protein
MNKIKLATSTTTTANCNKSPPIQQSHQLLFCHTTPIPNLTTLQESILDTIKQNSEITIAPADKNLDPVGINTKQ